MVDLPESVLVMDQSLHDGQFSLTNEPSQNLWEAFIHKPIVDVPHHARSFITHIFTASKQIIDHTWKSHLLTLKLN